MWIPIQFVEKRWGEVDVSIKFVTGYHDYCTMAFDGRGGDIAHAFYPYENEGMHFFPSQLFTISFNYLIKYYVFQKKKAYRLKNYRNLFHGSWSTSKTR